MDRMNVYFSLFVSINLFGLTKCYDVQDPCTGGPRDVVFVIDSSNSIWLSDFDLELDFVKHMVDLLPVGTSSGNFRVGLVTYSHMVRLQFHLGYYTEKYSAKRAIGRVQYLGGGTYTGYAIQFVSQQMFQEIRGARLDATRTIVVITDGLSQNTTSTSFQASLARYHGAEIFVIGVGPGVDQDELASVASNPDKHFLFRVDSFSDLDGIKGKLATRLCEPAQQRDSSNPDIRRGDTAPEIPPQPKLPQNCGGKPAEVFFLVDASSSIWLPDFEQQLAFIKHIVTVFDIGPERTRVGVIAFSDRVRPVIALNDYQEQSGLLQAIDGIPYLTGGTDTAGAIRYLREEGFSKTVARSDVAHVGIILTDGQSENVDATKEQAGLAHEEGVYLFAIGIGGNMDKLELRDIANDPDENFVFMVDNFEALTSIQDILAIKTCEVKPPVQQDYACSQRSSVDMVFAFDQNEMTSEETEKTLNFIRELTGHLDVGPEATRVGLMVSDCPSVIPVHLSDHSNQADFAKELIPMRVPRMYHLLKKLRHHSFSHARKNTPKVAVIFVNKGLGKHYKHSFREAHMLKREDVEIFVVAIGDEPKDDHMAAISSNPPSDHILSASDFDNLSVVKHLLLDGLCEVV